jgi:hypothetical protein
MVFPFLQKDFRQQRIYDMSQEVLRVETLHGRHHINNVKYVDSQITVNMTLTLLCRWSDSPSLGPHLAPHSILLNAGTLTQTGPSTLSRTSEMNQALSLAKLAVITRKFQVGDNTDPESTHAEPSANGSFAFQMNPANGG